MPGYFPKPAPSDRRLQQAVCHVDMSKCFVKTGFLMLFCKKLFRFFLNIEKLLYLCI